jgi:hypothetical protein
VNELNDKSDAFMSLGFDFRPFDFRPLANFDKLEPSSNLVLAALLSFAAMSLYCFFDVVFIILRTPNSSYNELIFNAKPARLSRDKM